MNLILFVLSIVMILAAMTYNRFESFSKSYLQAEQWRQILVEKQRDRFNQQQKKCPPAKKAAEPKEEKEPKAKSTPPGSGQISLSLLLARGKPGHEEAMTLLKNLLTRLWGNQPFFKQLAEKRPDFLDALLNDMVETAERAALEKKEIKTLDGFITTNWGDIELKVAFGRMLQEGLVYHRDPEPREENPDIIYEAPPGFQTLRDYFTTKKHDQIRLWLAQRPLLESIFPDKQTVDEFIKERKAIYNELKRKEANREQIQQHFKETFSSKTPFKELLDWEVTLTNPSKLK